MIVEFYGAPGAGKTYLASQVIDSCAKDGKTAINVVELGRSSVRYKAVNKVVRPMLNIIPRYASLEKKLMEIVKAYVDVKAKYNDEGIDGFVDNIVYYSFWYQRYETKDGLYIFDEGIVHQYLNMIANYGVTVDEVLRIHQIVPFLPQQVYVECSEDVNLTSFKGRNRHVCYIDELEGEELSDCLHAYQNACVMVNTFLRPIVVHRKNDVKQNAALVQNHLGL